MTRINEDGKYFLGLIICCALLCSLVLSSTQAGKVVAQEATTEFVMAYGSDIGELNPMFYRSERSHWYDMLVYDTLISYDDDLDPIPWLCESFDVDPDGTEITFSIRTGATWHDGTPLTAYDVAFTFGYYKDAPEDAIAWSFMQHITTISVVGNDVTVELDQSFTFALQTLGNLFILPEHVRNGIDADDNRWDDYANVTAHTGSGPFKYVERIPDEYTELERFDSWWGPDNPNIGQIPNIETVRIEVVPGQLARLQAMVEGEADTERYEVFGPYIDVVLSYSQLQLVTGAVSQWDYVLGFNLDEAPFNDPYVRDAVALAIDRDELGYEGNAGYAVPTYNCIPEVFYSSYHHSDGDFPAQDIDIANQILDDAGYTSYTGDYRIGLEFDLWVLAWDYISVNTGLCIREQLAEIGIECNVVVQDDDPMYEGIYQEPHAYVAYEMSHGIDTIPDHVWWRMHSDNIGDWKDNCYGLDNATVDSDLDDFVGSTPSTLEAAARQVQIDCLENKPYIPLFLSGDTHAMRAEWVNYTIQPGGLFSSFNPRTMVFMYDNGLGTVTTTTVTLPVTTTSITTTTTEPTDTTDTDTVPEPSGWTWPSFPPTTNPDTTTNSDTTDSDTTPADIQDPLPMLVTITSIGVVVVFGVLICRSKK